MTAEMITLTDELLAQVRSFAYDVDMSQFLEVNALFANLSSLIHHSLEGLNWVGFYYLKEDGDLILGPFAGKPACTLLRKGKGVCQRSVENREMVVVEDVHAFPGHIACDSESESELVYPVTGKGRIFAVLDVDSSEKGHFTGELQSLFREIGAILDS